MIKKELIENSLIKEYEQVKGFVKEKLKKATIKFLESNTPQKIDFRLIKTLLSKKLNNSTHQLHYYPAKILVDIPNFFLFDDDYSSKNGVLLDPFAGSGTVLLTGITHPIHQMNTYGVELNPMARLISKVKTTTLDIEKVKNECEVLINKIKNDKEVYSLPIYENLDFWFVKKAQNDLSRIKHHVDSVKNVNIRDFFYVCLSSIIRKSSLADPHVPPPVILKAEHFRKKTQKSEIEAIIKEKKNPKTLQYFKLSIYRNLEKIVSLNFNLQNTNVKSQVIWDNVLDFRLGKYQNTGAIDKRNARKLKNVDLIITSPPYINAQKYVRTFKLELLWLGLLNEEEILQLDKNNVGTERVYADNYNEITLVGDKLADSTIKKLFKLDKKRAGIVSKYYVDMDIAIKNIYDSLRPGGKFILIVGNNSVLNHKVRNHQILINLAMNSGFEVKLIIKDDIVSRGLFTKRHESADIIAEEWIVVLQKP